MLGRMMGAAPIIVVDKSQSALERALRLGADLVVRADKSDSAEAVRELTGGRGVDIALECVGLGQGGGWRPAASVAVGGRAVVVGLSPDQLCLPEITPWVRSEVTLIPSSAFRTQEIQELVELAAAGRLDLSQSITRTVSLAEAEEGLAYLDANPGEIMRLVVNSF